MSRPPRRPTWHWTTLLVSIALAGTLGATLYFATSSLPYLASSPTTDPTFGALNACLHHLVPSRTGFAVSRDARQAAAWSTNLLARCALGTDETRETTWAIPGVTVGAFDGAGTLWVVSQPGGLSSVLLEVTEQGQTAHGETAAVDLVGTATGIVVLEHSGRLLALSSQGEAGGLAQVPQARKLKLSASADGQRVAVTGDGAMRVFDAKDLRLVRSEAPCDVREFWWLPHGRRALFTCSADDLALVLDMDTGAQETAQPGTREASTLAGPDGPFVLPCDVLPCTAPPPLEQRP